MAIPLAIAGIPWLASVLGALFGSLITFFIKFFSKKLAITAAYVTGALMLFSVFFGAIFALLQLIRVAAPPELSLALSAIVPSNAPVCIGAIASAHVARWVYDWNMRTLQFRLSL